VPNRYITSIAVDPKNAAHVYLSVGSYSRRWIPTAGYGHVFESTNGGKTWRDVSGNLPDAPVYKVVLHGKQLVVGTEVGAFVGTVNKKGHGSWARLGRNLPNVTVWDLTVAPDGRIVAGTHGRGDWEIKLR
jgi:sugar lactone lactonase YvrE